MSVLPQPWLEDALEQLDLRRRDRCLVLTCPTTAHVAAVSRIVGKTSRIVVVEPEQKLAEAASHIAHQRLEVLHHDPQGGERFGSFDALLACPLTTMGWPMQRWTGLLKNNLRPGGRFVTDLPAEVLCEPLQRAWAQIHGDPSRLAPITGPGEADLAGALRRVGMRNVEAAMGTHLITLESPYVLAAFLAELWPGESIPTEDLAITLVEILKSTEEVDVICHRTRVHGQR